MCYANGMSEAERMIPLSRFTRVAPSQVREGDRMASAGPAGLYAAHLVTWVQPGPGDITHIATEVMRPDDYLRQPEAFGVWILSRDTR